MKRFSIFANEIKDPQLTFSRKLASYCESCGCTAAITTGGEIDSQTDIVLALGGDGTILTAARAAVRASLDNPIPILGINMGTLGFLAETEPEGAQAALQQILKGDYTVEHRMLLHGEVTHADGGTEKLWALNDIVAARAGAQRILNYNVYVDGLLLNKYLADGIIVTTPTGSTGYNLSAGGPIVEPSANLFVLTPICAHTMNDRSLVLSPDSEVVIELPIGRDGRPQTAEIHYDEGVTYFNTGGRIRITRSAQSAAFVKLTHTSQPVNSPFFYIS